MPALRALAAFLVLAASAALAAAADPAAAPRRILFIGNSLTYGGDVPRRVAQLAGAMGREVHAEMVAQPGFSLADHWRDGRALAAIRRGGWDVVVLQQGTSAHDEGRIELAEYARRFAPEIRAAGARPAMYMVWPLVDRPRDFPGTIRAYREAARAIDAQLLPVGEAWLRVLNKNKRIKLYADGIHATSLGSDLIVLTLYMALFPAGPQEFTQAYVDRIARHLDMREDLVDPFFDAATRAIDEPLRVD